MTAKPEKIVSGRFELTKHLDDTYILTHRKEGKALASWSEFLELSKEILRHEIEENSTINNDPCSHFDS